MIEFGQLRTLGLGPNLLLFWESIFDGVSNFAGSNHQHKIFLLPTSWKLEAMYFHPIFLIVPTLAMLCVGGISFAIVGKDNRSAWLLIAPGVAIIWLCAGELLSSLANFGEISSNQLSAGFLVQTLSYIGLPIFMCITALAFRRWRERPPQANLLE